MRLKNNDLTLYAVTDRTWLNNRSLAQCVEQAIQGGVTLVQLREKQLEYTAFVELANEIKQVCHQYNVPLIINDNLEVAKACDADGIHIGQSDETLIEVRKNWSADKIYGVSTQTVKQAQKAQELGATYLGVGAVFPTSTKNDADDVSLTELANIVQAVQIPVCAIGGINQTNISKLYDTGIDGVALISEIFNQDDIKANAQQLTKLVEPFK
ncbi:thiamine-phosphate synthase [Companilactobacillus sp. RD055328]|uniref:thiamine phosphate synthase n=1 Tax=Companilactobacillus sp. RD055328 TaxID=2916634 RepID=UPI001FC891D5|nr:thiamine phosphate synthase [Companilactobacillus sp. RD055328]GKQ42200.1 thiamine-phosphate synthase [Companilactobacillus sp. RD055328]